MMKRRLGVVFLFSCGIALAGQVASAANSSGIFLNTGANGSTELSNIPGEQGDELAIASPEAPARPAPAAANPLQTATQGNSPMAAPTAESGKTALATKTVTAPDSTELSANEQYRNHIQQQLQGSAGNVANPAVSRRYLMQSRPPVATFGF